MKEQIKKEIQEFFSKHNWDYKFIIKNAPKSKGCPIQANYIIYVQNDRPVEWILKEEIIKYIYDNYNSVVDFK